MNRSIEEAIDSLAARQCGLVTRAQLLDAGSTPEQVKYRIRAGRLRPLVRGVYQLGPILAPHAKEMAAVLACGRGAVVSHRSAASLWQLLPALEGFAPIDITVPGRNRRRRPAVRFHRVPSLEPEHVTAENNVPVTTPARTVLDLAGTVCARKAGAGTASRRELEQAVAQCERRGLASASDLLALICDYPARKGVRVLRPLLEGSPGTTLLRSEAEERFLALVRKAQLSAPDTNVFLGSYEIDFLWRVERLVVEVDGFAFHSSKKKFESDRRRDAELSARGFRIMRVTWQQIECEPEAMLVRLAQTLARSAAT